MKKDLKTVIEITDTNVKIIQTKKDKSHRVISYWASKSLQNFTDQEVIETLIGMLRAINIQDQQLIALIPRRFVILKQLRLPSQDENEIQKMVGLHLVNQIPYNIEDVTYDYSILNKEKSGYTQVLVIVVHNEVCGRYLNIFNSIGVEVTQLTLSSLGILNWLNFQEIRTKTEIKKPVAVLNIDESHSEICFCHQRKLLFSRHINYGAKDMDEDNRRGLLEQIELSVNAYQKDEMGPNISKMFIVSNAIETSELKASLEKELECSVQILSFEQNVPSLKKINISTFKDQTGLSLTVGIGILFFEDKKVINLTPKEVSETKQTNLRKRQWITVSALFLLTCVLGSAVPGLNIYQKNLRLKSINESIDDYKSKVKKARLRIQFVKFFNEEFKERIFIPDVINEFYHVIPAEIYVRSLHFDEKGLFTIQGFAIVRTNVNELQESMVNSPLFKKVKLKFATKRKVFNQEVTDFKLTTELIEIQKDES